MRRTLVAPLMVVVSAVLAGGWLLQRDVRPDQNIYLQVRLFQEVVDHVAEQFVDAVEKDSLYQEAIDGILQDLDDPNTSLIRASEYEDFRIRTEGDYGGVGLEIIEQDGRITVLSPIPGTPGARSGIRPGDRFARIADQDVTEWTTDQTADFLRGRPGTSVEVLIERPGADELIPFTLTRERIQLMAVPFTTMLEDGIGYVPLRQFQETASSEVRAAVDGLGAQGLRGLVLDLRGNPGGLLEEGIGVADLFLDPGQAVVETRGRDAGRAEVFEATVPGSYDGLPLVVLVNETSASASEIVAGALQDHDRALVLGNTTWGKGSVQTLYRLSGGNVLRLTTARWFTPVGRSIQKDPEEQRQIGAASTLGLDGRLTVRPQEGDRPVFASKSGRTLWGGGGITPDLIVMPDTLGSRERAAVRALSRETGAFYQALFEFSTRFIQENPDLEPDFEVTAEMIEQIRLEMGDDGARVRQGVFEEADRYVRYQLGLQIASQAWGDQGAFERVRGQDRQLERALELLRDAGTPDDLFVAAQGMEESRALAKVGEEGASGS